MRHVGINLHIVNQRAVGGVVIAVGGKHADGFPVRGGRVEDHGRIGGPQRQVDNQGIRVLADEAEEARVAGGAAVDGEVVNGIAVAVEHPAEAVGPREDKVLKALPLQVKVAGQPPDAARLGHALQLLQRGNLGHRGIVLPAADNVQVAPGSLALRTAQNPARIGAGHRAGRFAVPDVKVGVVAVADQAARVLGTADIAGIGAVLHLQRRAGKADQTARTDVAAPHHRHIGVVDAAGHDILAVHLGIDQADQTAQVLFGRGFLLVGQAAVYGAVGYDEFFRIAEQTAGKVFFVAPVGIFPVYGDVVKHPDVAVGHQLPGQEAVVAGGAGGIGVDHLHRRLRGADDKVDDRGIAALTDLGKHPHALGRGVLPGQREVFQRIAAAVQHTGENLHQIGYGAPAEIDVLRQVIGVAGLHGQELLRRGNRNPPLPVGRDRGRGAVRRHGAQRESGGKHCHCQKNETEPFACFHDVLLFRMK